MKEYFTLSGKSFRINEFSVVVISPEICSLLTELYANLYSLIPETSVNSGQDISIELEVCSTIVINGSPIETGGDISGTTNSDINASLIFPNSSIAENFNKITSNSLYFSSE